MGLNHAHDEAGGDSRQGHLAEGIAAVLLVGAGAILLLHNLGLLGLLSPLLWAGLFLGGGALFLFAFLVDRTQWWPLIPSSALVGLGATILLGATCSGQALQGGPMAGAALFACIAAGFLGVYAYDRRRNWWALIPAGATAALVLVILAAAAHQGELAGAVLFLGIGTIFLVLYFVEIGGQRHNWWTLIPAGALFSLAAVIVLSAFGAGAAAASALFLGLGLTFGVLYLMRGPERPLGWAWIPAVALLGFGAFVLLISSQGLWARLVWPLMLVVAGLVLVVVNLRRQGS